VCRTESQPTQGIGGVREVGEGVWLRKNREGKGESLPGRVVELGGAEVLRVGQSIRLMQQAFDRHTFLQRKNKKKKEKNKERRTKNEERKRKRKRKQKREKEKE